MVKVISWLMVNGASILGFLQVILKGIKEILTGVVNLISIFLSEEKAEKLVKSIRGFINKADTVVEVIKEFLIK
jgi:hypothetical protein